MNDLSSATCISCCCYCCCCCFSESFGSTAVYIAIILETSGNDYPIPFVETTQTAYEEFNTDSHKVRLSLELLINNNPIIASFSYPTLHFKQLLFTVFNILTANIFTFRLCKFRISSVWPLPNTLLNSFLFHTFVEWVKTKYLNCSLSTSVY